jgi:hypothetical protein
MGKKSQKIDDHFVCELEPDGTIKSMGRTAVAMIKGLTSCDRAVALIMIEYTFQDGICKIPKERMAAETAYSVPMVFKSIANLRRHRFCKEDQPSPYYVVNWTGLVNLFKERKALGQAVSKAIGKKKRAHNDQMRARSRKKIQQYQRPEASGASTPCELSSHDI